MAGLETAGERAGVEGGRHGSPILGDCLKPECAEVTGLLDALGGEEGVEPSFAVCAVEKGPMTLLVAVSDTNHVLVRNKGELKEPTSHSGVPTSFSFLLWYPKPWRVR